MEKSSFGKSLSEEGKDDFLCESKGIVGLPNSKIEPNFRNGSDNPSCEFQEYEEHSPDSTYHSNVNLIGIGQDRIDDDGDVISSDDENSSDVMNDPRSDIIRSHDVRDRKGPMGRQMPDLLSDLVHNQDSRQHSEGALLGASTYTPLLTARTLLDA